MTGVSGTQAVLGAFKNIKNEGTAGVKANRLLKYDKIDKELKMGQH